MKKSNSAYILPILSQSRRINRKNLIHHSLFMTISDDMGFANKQIEKIEEIVKKDKENEQKPWKKNILNNIYISNGKNNYQILKELTQRFKIIKNDDISKLDWSKQSYLNNKQINQIKEGNKISKRVLEKVEIEFILQTKNISLNNIKMKLIKNERKKVFQKEIDYQNALDYEKKSLEKDIDNFDVYKLETKQRLKNDEIILVKLIQKNKLLYEENKKLAHEYKYIIEEIIRYIKLIINYKTYASFVHTLIDQENKILNVNLNEYINYKNWTEKDLNTYIKKALNELNLYLKEISLNENTLDLLSDNNRLEILFQIMEDNILQVFKEKEKFEKEEKRIMDENMKKYDKLMKDYENNKAKYEITMAEINDEKIKISKYNVDPELFDYYNEMTILLDQICNFILLSDDQKELKKSMSQPNFTSSSNQNNNSFNPKLVKKSVEFLKQKQFYVQDLIDELEGYDKEDHEFFKVIINEAKINNRILRREIENQRQIKQQIIKRENLLKKYRKSIIKQKCKLKEQIPYHIIKERSKHIVKYKPESTSENLLFY